ncbi:SH3 domain-containing protein [Leptospira idonii]|uniref:SH3 domain-containing protein n=1 Tax=Leptospira idonii TaxID=1193500 RepID=A0A4R9LZX1_9LEPT|nr:SH3 domain-containing protein [Leptospira idonii]TGN19312.1 SH3 domain-containing protein [Leptospira idonii]
MKFIQVIVLYIIITMWVGSCSKTEGYIYSNAVSGLRIRTLPNLNSEKIATFPYKEKAVLIEKEERLDEIDGLVNYWYKIKYSGHTGWVFGAYISHIPLEERKPDADAYTGLIYKNDLPNFKTVSVNIISEQIRFSIYSGPKNHFYGFLEEQNRLDEQTVEKKILHSIQFDLGKNEEFLQSINQCFTPDEQEIIFAIYYLEIDTTGETIGNHYELEIKKFKIIKSWLLSEDKQSLLPLNYTKGIKCIFPDPANILEPVSD